MEQILNHVMALLSLEEKATLCAGVDFWNTAEFPEKNVLSFKMSDGPHGLRCQSDAQDHMGLAQSEPATCFPCSAATACSWDRDLLREIGAALGDECRANGVAVLLGPGVNIKRSPLCGRNFEYFSEDPFLSSDLAGSYIEGVQSRSVGCALKHFAVNNQETRRMTVDAKVDERALREIYLASFEGAVKKAKPWMVMAAYNRVGGEYCCENKRLLSDILRDEWGYDGLVVSDWNAVSERVTGLLCGMDLEMPGPALKNKQSILEALKSGELSEEVLDKAVSRILHIAISRKQSKDGCIDVSLHHKLAERAALESMVLLKNDGEALPLKRKGSLAVIGEFAEKLRIQGAGSSRVNPTRVDNLFEELASIAGSSVGITYARGYSFEADASDDSLLSDAIETARSCESIIVMAGIPDKVESEGFDRPHMKLPDNQNRLIEELAKLGKKIVVVLIGGAPVELPWINKADSVIAAYLSGQATASALARLLYGSASPCGKLAETWPVCCEHNPSYLHFPDEDDIVEYKEGIFVGYRYYEGKKISPLFSFGHGLSYTSFTYSNLKLSKQSIKDSETLTVTLDITNTGNLKGKEIVQLYVGEDKPIVPRPKKELKGFCKTELLPGQKATVSFTLDKRAFAYYEPKIGDWRVESGKFTIHVGASSADIRLSEYIELKSDSPLPVTYTPMSTIGDIAHTEPGKQMISQILKGWGTDDEQMLGVSVYDMVRDFPIIKLISMADNSDGILEGILTALNAKN